MTNDAQDPGQNDATESPRDEIAENVSPGQGAVIRPTPSPPPHPDKVRMWLAIAMVVILAGIVLVACVGWLRGSTGRELQSLAIVLSPVVTLVGTILGFYFSSDIKK